MYAIITSLSYAIVITWLYISKYHRTMLCTHVTIVTTVRIHTIIELPCMSQHHVSITVDYEPQTLWLVYSYSVTDRLVVLRTIGETAWDPDERTRLPWMTALMVQRLKFRSVVQMLAPGTSIFWRCDPLLIRNPRSNRCLARPSSSWSTKMCLQTTCRSICPGGCPRIATQLNHFKNPPPTRRQWSYSVVFLTPEGSSLFPRSVLIYIQHWS